MIPQAGHDRILNPQGYVWGSQVLARVSLSWEKAEAGSVGESHGAAGLDLRNLHWDNGYPAREQERQRQGGHTLVGRQCAHASPRLRQTTDRA